MAQTDDLDDIQNVATDTATETRLYGSAEGASMAPLAPGVRLRKFQYTSLDANSNKWYTYEIKGTGNGWDGKGMVEVTGRFGRVGDKGQEKHYGKMSEDDFERLVRERLRKGYVEIELHAVKPGTVSTSTALAAVAGAADTPEDRFISLIYREAGETIKEYLAEDVDALSLPQIALGRALLDTINHTRGTYGLGNIGRGAGAPDAARRALARLSQSTVADSVEAYYKAIPTILPRRIDRTALVDSFDVTEQENRLNQLEAAIQTIKAQASGQTQRQALDDVEICWLDPSSGEHASLRHYAESTGSRSPGGYGGFGGYGGHVRVQDIYRVTIPAERARYKDFITATYEYPHSTAPTHGTANKKILFHGTANGNWRHILRSGLKIMSTHAHGTKLGCGLYFANQSAKGANYCSTAGKGDAPMIMMLSEVALGRMSERSSWSGDSAPQGYDSIYSSAVSSGYPYDEYCIFDAARCTARYMITFRA